jgi:ribosome-associated protein
MSDDAESAAERPSRGARKRAAQSAQELGERLIALPDAELAALGLPEPLLDAVREGRRITSRAAGARQRQYIGKLMRAIDCDPIAAALAARSERDALDSQRFARAESWRDRLLTEGTGALAELAQRHPSIDVAAWGELLERARSDADAARAPGAARAAQRELFRALRDLLG